MKTIKYILKSILIGLVSIFVFNFIFSKMNLNVPLNVITIIIVGTLRLPGLACIIVYSLL